MELLRLIEELREPEDFFGEVPNEKPQKEMIDLAGQLINQNRQSSIRTTTRTAIRKR